MKKITRQAALALKNLRWMSENNTQVTLQGSGDAQYSILFLRGAPIATYDPQERTVELADNGRRDPLTIERLNGVLETFHFITRIFQYDGVWHVGDPKHEWCTPRWIGQVTLHLHPRIPRVTTSDTPSDMRRVLGCPTSLGGK